MAKQQTCHKYVYKIHSTRLRKAKWDLTLPLKEARKNNGDVIALSDSQVLRWIDELNGNTDVDATAKYLKSEIKRLKHLPKDPKLKRLIVGLYDKLYSIQFQPDYLCVIMDKVDDYDRLNQGFKINGIPYHRFLGTNGGIKRSTIVYVSERLYPELKKRLDNGRNKDVPLVPAKLEAYQALACSASIPVSFPRIIVVNDCETKFLDDVIYIDDENDGEPSLTYKKDSEITLNCCDGCGMMSPAMSRKWNGELGGNPEETVSGVNTRCAWTKGMLFTFDFVEFAEKVAGTYEIIDAWGDKRDVREADAILTTSMLKLWDSYDSYDDYYANCMENHYGFGIAKTAPHKLENVHSTNYQFLQSYELTDEQIDELIAPTVNEIRDILGLDYRKTILFLKGTMLDQGNVKYLDNDIDKALMIEPELINDPFIRSKLWGMIKKRIVDAKLGVIDIEANYSIISGDLYALAQNMFGMEVTGLLKANEIYHKYWIDKGSKEVVCFRAPMTCHNNIRKANIADRDDVKYWFRYIETCSVLSAWDTITHALNGADCDGDLQYITDNPVILESTRVLPAIECIQRKAAKKIVTTEDLIAANKGSFGDAIGSTTNKITSQIERQAGFERGSDEYKALEYRIMCGQLYQQNSIDRAKGIISKSMPTYWYNMTQNYIRKDDSEETKTAKEFNAKICADRKPYFMAYRYPELMKQYRTYMKSENSRCISKFGKTIEELLSSAHPTDDEKNFIEWHRKEVPVGDNPFVTNKICWRIEDEFSKLRAYPTEETFDYTILKNDAVYTRAEYNKINNIYEEFKKNAEDCKKRKAASYSKVDIEELETQYQLNTDAFIEDCVAACPNEDALCNIVLDICYNTNTSKQFAWMICGDVIIKNLLKKKDNIINTPVRDNDGDLLFRGEKFSIQQIKINEEEFLEDEVCDE